MRSILTAVLLFAFIGSAAGAEEPAPKKAPVQLFNGQNLDGWYSFLENIGKDQDPNQIFTVVDGTIRILGKDFGYIATRQLFENYRLKMEFKWGTQQFAPRATGKRDSGVLYHFPEGEPDKIWPKSLEFQVQEGDCGDIWCVAAADVISPGAQEYSWGQKHVLRSADFERPHGEWNTIEIVARGDSIEHYMNGQLVNTGTKANVRRGKILLQSEGAEVFYRRIELTPE